MGRACAVAAAAAVDRKLAAQISAVSDWRSGYLKPFRGLTEVAAVSAPAAHAVSEAGLSYLRRTMQFARYGEVVSLEQMPEVAPALKTIPISSDVAPVRELVVPFEGKRLSGPALRAKLEDWVAAGWVEPGFAEAVSLVTRNPDWLDTSDVTVALLGAGAEMGPVHSLLKWGGRVLAVDLPNRELWSRLIARAASSAGTLEVPVPLDFNEMPSAGELAAGAGADVIAGTPELLALLRGVKGPLVLGNYLYADSGLHVRASLAADALAVGLADRDDLMLAYLATPTDAFAVPWRDVEISHDRWRHRRTKFLQGPLHLFGQFEPNYERTITTASGTRMGIADCLVPQQGPNYALAKRLQRWRAVLARAAGTRVSLNVAPATRTRSVVKNRALAAAYAGAHRFGIKVFDPATANTLMAAMLVHDLRNDSAAANPATQLDTPVELFTRAANHGGLWTTGYEPRSVLGFAAALGLFESRA